MDDVEKSPQAEVHWGKVGESGRRTYTGRWHKRSWASIPNRARRNLGRQMERRRRNPELAYPNAPTKRVQSMPAGQSRTQQPWEGGHVRHGNRQTKPYSDSPSEQSGQATRTRRMTEGGKTPDLSKSYNERIDESFLRPYFNKLKRDLTGSRLNLKLEGTTVTVIGRSGIDNMSMVESAVLNTFPNLDYDLNDGIIHTGGRSIPRLMMTFRFSSYQRKSEVNKILPIVGVAARAAMGGKKILDAVTDDDDDDKSLKSMSLSDAKGVAKRVFGVRDKSVEIHEKENAILIYTTTDKIDRKSDFISQTGMKHTRTQYVGGYKVGMVFHVKSDIAKGKRMNSLIWGLVAGAGGFMVGQVLREKLMGRGVPRSSVDRAINNALNTTYQVHDRTARLVRKGKYIDISDKQNEDSMSYKVYHDSDIKIGNTVMVNGDEGRVNSVSKSHAVIAFKNGKIHPVHLKAIQNMDADYFVYNDKLKMWDELGLMDKTNVLTKCNLPTNLASRTWSNMIPNAKSVIMDKMVQEKVNVGNLAPRVNPKKVKKYSQDDKEWAASQWYSLGRSGREALLRRLGIDPEGHRSDVGEDNFAYVTDYIKRKVMVMYVSRGVEFNSKNKADLINYIKRYNVSNSAGRNAKSDIKVIKESNDHVEFELLNIRRSEAMRIERDIERNNPQWQFKRGKSSMYDNGNAGITIIAEKIPDGVKKSHTSKAYVADEWNSMTPEQRDKVIEELPTAYPVGMNRKRFSQLSGEEREQVKEAMGADNRDWVKSDNFDSIWDKASPDRRSTILQDAEQLAMRTGRKDLAYSIQADARILIRANRLPSKIRDVASASTIQAINQSGGTAYKSEAGIALAWKDMTESNRQSLLMKFNLPREWAQLSYKTVNIRLSQYHVDDDKQYKFINSIIPVWRNEYHTRRANKTETTTSGVMNPVHDDKKRKLTAKTRSKAMS